MNVEQTEEFDIKENYGNDCHNFIQYELNIIGSYTLLYSCLSS